MPSDVASGVPTRKYVNLQEVTQADCRIVKILDRRLPELDQDEGPEERPDQHPELQIAVMAGDAHPGT